jgi:4-hydroxy-2-oxoheptanedioate aldolase
VIATANDEILVVTQIETLAAVENVEELCSVEGVDVLFIGPSDLSQSLGVPGELSHPSVLQSIERVAAAVGKSNKALGLFAGTAEIAEYGLELGATFIATGVEALLGGPMRTYVSGVRDWGR